MKFTTIKFSLLAVITTVLFFTCSKEENQLKVSDLTGAYSVMESCDDYDDSYDIVITAVGNDGKTIQIYNLWDWEEYVTATINGNTLTISSQVLDEVTFVGTGSLSGNTLTINYSATDDSETDQCIAVCQKQ